MRKLLCAAFVALACGAAHAQSLTFVGKVESVRDADRVQVLDLNQRRHEVRLAGIDAPADTAVDARRHLAAAIQGKLVRIVVLERGAGNRLVGQIWLNDQDVNLAQIEAGRARTGEASLGVLPPSLRAGYAQAMANAQAQGIGMWSPGAAAGSNSPGQP